MSIVPLLFAGTAAITTASQENQKKEESEKLRELFDKAKNDTGLSRKDLVSKYNFPGGYGMVQQHISGNKAIGIKSALAYANAFGIRLSDLSPRLADEINGIQAMPVMSADNATESISKIKLVSAKGSCGGGSHVFDVSEKNLIKEESFFTHYKVKPENLIALYADGDSMADFIVDGDIVIFDVSKTEIIGGKIYLIEHPDGLRIKRINKDLKGGLILSSNNPDKNKYPDEFLNPNDLEYLKIKGQFVYRQGGF